MHNQFSFDVTKRARLAISASCSVLVNKLSVECRAECRMLEHVQKPDRFALQVKTGLLAP